MSQLAAPPPPAERLTLSQVLGLGALALAFVVFGFFVEYRAAFLQRHMTDLQVYLRAAWAARTGADIYAVTDDNHWHYHYPPLPALLTMPLADAPPGVDRRGLLPFGVSVAVWYALSVVCLLLGVHVLAAAVDPAAVVGGPRWWGLRFWSIMACLPPIAATLMRGQVNLMLVALLCAAGAALLRGQSWRAGLWIAGAVCLKVIPAFLLVYPLWRRDGRCLGGCAVGLLVGLVLLPAAWFGPARTAAYFDEWCDVLVRPALGSGDHHARDKELILVTSTDSQSLGATIHNTLYLNRDTRPNDMDPWVRVAHWIASAVMAGLTLLAFGWRAGGHRLRPLIFLGALALVMVMASPVCHLHYFCLALPLVMALIGRAWEGHTSLWPGAGLAALLAVNFVVNGLTHLPGTDVTRDLGLAAYATLMLWLVAIVILWRTRPRADGQGRLPTPRGAGKVNTWGELSAA